MDNSLLFSSFQLPCGLVLPNRIIKAAMSDSLGDGFGNPTIEQKALYKNWALGGVAASIIGEVQCDPRFPEKPGNLLLNNDSDEQAFQELAKAGAKNNALLWLQLGHAGALTYPPVGSAMGPSALNLPSLLCDALSLSDIALIPSTFATAACRAKDFGFSGVQIHAGHGFLLSQFLSPLFNKRTDQYGGNITNRMRLIAEIISEVKYHVGQDMAVTLKINSSDQLDGGLNEDDSLHVIKDLNNAGLDLIDISGGTYFPGAPASSDRVSSGPYFIDFAAKARQVTTTPLMATGGFKTKQQAIQALSSGAIDMVGIARALVLEPTLPTIWQSSDKNPVFPTFTLPPEGGITAWYSMQLTSIAQTQHCDTSLTLDKALQTYNTRDEARIKTWLSRLA